ncbi:amidohydrolase family protein [Pararobbsia silviterrae]|uniref:Amidohydrolase n=1 Tax=Pararobbsia silviterrae TaxID=1792498 RepID=A0A494Y8D2_9BURK|nr:amidohydrolase family protein [Pararobbsia silviterrae]RKP57847.1 amidohydrolase [Pararobbsia silviterrae]
MLIVDAQIHIWAAGIASAHHTHKQNPFTTEALQSEMLAAGVDCALLAPPGWDPGGNDYSLEAARVHPGRFAVTGGIDWKGPPDPRRIRDWRKQAGMYGLRLSFNTPEKQAQLAGGIADWIWTEAERADLPVMLLIPGGVPLVADIARRFPNLRICVDHLGIPRGAKDGAAFEHLPQLLSLAAFRNISVKAGGLPTYSTIDAFPHPSLHGYLRQVYDAYGPERMFWASDLTRMSCRYREVVTLMTEGIPWLSQQDKRLIMGESVCHWLGWSPATGA